MAKPEITKAMLLADLAAVATRLGVRRVTSTLYRQEGAFTWTFWLRRRIGFISWSQLCCEAGLLPTVRGCRGIDRRPCHRCGRERNYYGTGDRWCKTCRKTLRRRKTELVG